MHAHSLLAYFSSLIFDKDSFYIKMFCRVMQVFILFKTISPCYLFYYVTRFTVISSINDIYTQRNISSFSSSFLLPPHRHGFNFHSSASSSSSDFAAWL